MACCSSDCAPSGKREAKPITQTAHAIALLKNFCMDLLDHLVDTTGQRHSRNGIYGISPARRPGAHAGLMLAALITLPHFSVSSAMNLPKSDGDNPNGVPPKSAIRAFKLGSARPALISLLILSMTSSGVPLGAPIPYHALTS